MTNEAILALAVAMPMFLFFAIAVPILKRHCKGMMSTRWLLVSYAAALMMMLVLDFSWLDMDSRQIVLVFCGSLMCLYMIVKSVETWLRMGYVGNVEAKKGDASVKFGINHSGEWKQPNFSQSEDATDEESL